MSIFPQLPLLVLEIAVEPKSKADQAKLVIALSELASEDPFFRASTDDESGQTILKGTDELQLDQKINSLRQTYALDVNIGAPQVAYRETPAKRVETDYTHKTRIGGAAQFARVKIIVEPAAAGTGCSFESNVVGGSIPDAFSRGIAGGIDSVMRAGILAGFPLVDVKVTLIDGAFHDVDSSVLAFEIAARSAFRQALKDAGSVLLEPVMAVEVLTPEDYVGSVIGDVHGRRGEIQSREVCEDTVLVRATVPLSNLFGYANQLRSFSQGRATFTMQFARYQIVPLAVPPDGKRPPPAAVALRA